VVEDRPGDPGAWRRLAEVLFAVAGDGAHLAGLAERARGAGRPRAAEEIARQILQLADRATERRHAGLGAETVSGTFSEKS
jgi:uncharacterized protein YjeT (DUF2065 family)